MGIEQERAMDDSKKQFLSTKNCKQRVHLGSAVVLISPLFYKERISEAKKLVNELRKTN
jgi:hypothetical protein